RARASRASTGARCGWSGSVTNSSGSASRGIPTSGGSCFPRTGKGIRSARTMRSTCRILPTADHALRHARAPTRSTSSGEAAMIHELRRYQIKPGKLADYVEKSGSIGRVVRGDRYGKLLGYWSTELGPLNQVVHLWEFADLAARTTARAGLAKDE